MTAAQPPGRHRTVKRCLIRLDVMMGQGTSLEAGSVADIDGVLLPRLRHAILELADQPAPSESFLASVPVGGWRLHKPPKHSRREAAARGEEFPRLGQPGYGAEGTLLAERPEEHATRSADLAKLAADEAAARTATAEAEAAEATARAATAEAEARTATAEAATSKAQAEQAESDAAAAKAQKAGKPAGK